MVKVKVEEEIEIIRNRLLPINDEVCLIYNLKKKYVYIITYPQNLSFVREQLVVFSVEDFTEEKKIEFMISEEFSNSTISGRIDFVDRV
ncbi:hypothetical protein [Flexithrix dorotheae]|uniref:hypothetical protein n=1 Tax=Flexithrix dorotheae TaxID=70993 RepID=UPI000368FADD|nr:hypothetical protein [Flexithrix dorotheae]